MSTEDLARALTSRTPVSWSPQMVRNLESGRKIIDPPLLRAIAEIQRRPPNYYLYMDFDTLPELSRVSSTLAKVIPIDRKRRQRAGRLIEPAASRSDPVPA